MQRKWVLVAALFSIAMITAACAGGKEGIVIDDAWVRPSPIAEGNGAAYMVITNYTGTDDALIGAKADFANMVEVHETTMGDGDMMQMQHVEAIEITAGGNATLEPGGYHIMLMGIQETLEPGTTVTITLVFEHAGEIVVEAPVKEQ